MDDQTASYWMQAMNSVNQAAGVIAQSNLNYNTREWNEKIMAMQRQWALSDRDELRDYNSPQAVMARAKAAGINPMYAATNGNVITASSPTRSVDTQSWHPQVPEMPKSDGLIPSLNAALLVAQINNVKSQNANIQADTELKLKNAQNVGLRSEAQALNNDTMRLLQSTKIGQEIARYAGLQEDIDVKKQQAFNLWERGNLSAYQLRYLHDENDRRQVMNEANLELAAERVLLIRKQQALTAMNTVKAGEEANRINRAIENMKKDGQIKDYLIRLQQSGLNPGDSQWLRIAEAIADMMYNR